MAELDINNFNTLINSQKILRSSYIVNMISEKIDNNQYLKRLLRYLTINPLSKQSIDLDGNDVIQPNIEDSLIGTIRDEKNIYLRGFNEKMKISEQCYVFINNPSNLYYDEYGYMYFKIDITVPNKYSVIVDSDGVEIERHKMIASLIDNMFDKWMVDEKKYSKNIGNIEFILSKYEEDRVNTTGDSIKATLMYRTTVTTNRCPSYD